MGLTSNDILYVSLLNGDRQTCPDIFPLLHQSQIHRGGPYACSSSHTRIHSQEVQPGPAEVNTIGIVFPLVNVYSVIVVCIHMSILRGKFQVLRKPEPEQRTIGCLFIGKQFISLYQYPLSHPIRSYPCKICNDLTVNKRDRI